ncbi:hypothetical protein CFter6_1487 [Collimonas fungivorans]|uniref:Uncharacterized protein n=1 Tax=Collimonas fungivorans TaxID=158899 RepID=A0A127P8P1_9BURK|nr:hypothetical protein CFter6_1487 [Collimonas fungivorans]
MISRQACFRGVAVFRRTLSGLAQLPTAKPVATLPRWRLSLI